MTSTAEAVVFWVLGTLAVLGAVGVVEQLGQVWLNALRITVIPLVFGLLVTGIVSIADAAATGRLAGRCTSMAMVPMASRSIRASRPRG